MKRIIACIIATVIVCGPVTINAQEISVIGDEPVIMVDDGSKSGTTLISLRNETEETVDLMLSSDKIINSITGKTTPARVLFSLQGQENFSPVHTGILGPGAIITLVARIDGFNRIGEYRARILNGDTGISDITIISGEIPLNLSLDAANPNSPEISFKKGAPGLIFIKNADNYDYLIDLSLYIRDPDGYISDSGILCKASGNTPVELEMPEKFFGSGFSGLFKDEVKEANIVFTYRSKSGLDIKTPSKTIPVEIRLQHHSYTAKTVLSAIIIFTVLFAGGAASLFLNLWIPNRLRRIDLKKRLNKIAGKIRPISNYVESELRVNILVERMRLNELVGNTKSLNPNSTAAFQGYRAEIDLLEKRVEVVQELDIVSRLFEDFKGKASGAPVKIMDEVEKMIGDASEILKIPAPREDDLRQAEDKIKKAIDELKSMSLENSALEENLARDVKHLIGIYADIKDSEKYRQLEEPLKDLLKLVDPDNNKYTEKEKIQPEHYHWLSSSIERLVVLRHYIKIWEEYEGRRERMEKREKEFIKNLRNRTWYALNLARQFRKEFEEDVYVEDIIKALGENAFTIEISPSSMPRQNQPVFLKVQFKDRSLNACSARKVFTCEWDFGYIGKENGWEISHYFRKQSEAEFKVTFYDHNGKPVKLKDGKTAYHKKDLEIQEGSKKFTDGRTKIEIIKFFVAFFLALIALYAGAKEQLLRLDVLPGLIAVLGIGFGADTIKNLITKQPQEES